jgi:predicted Zn-dependent protease
MPEVPSPTSWKSRLVLGLFALAVLGLAFWGGRHLWAWHHFRAGRAALEAGDLEAGRNHLAACLRVWGDSPEAHLLAAQGARRLDDLDSADHHLREHERLGGDAEPRTPEWAMLQAQRGQLADTRDYLRGVAEHNDAAAALALEALAKGDLRAARMDEALQCLDELLRRRPGDYAGHMLRGGAYRMLGEKDDALTDFEAAAAARPSSFEARLRRADAMSGVGRLADAVADYEALRRARPDNADVLLALARLRHDCHQLDEADALLDRLLADQPHNVGALGWRARIALRRGEGERAERWARQAAELAPEDREAATVLALTLDAQGKVDEARECRARVARIDDRMERMRRAMSGGRTSP